MRVRWRRFPAVLTPLLVLVSCQADDHHPEIVAPSSMAVPGPTQPGTVPVPASTGQPTPWVPRAPRTKAWVDLDVGDCLIDPPPNDPSIVTVTVVDCAAAHSAEVYLRARVAVNDAVTMVADQQCVAGFTPYTGASIDGGGYTITYLIDSMQNRTWENPEPSTVICALQAADGHPMTGTARR